MSAPPIDVVERLERLAAQAPDRGVDPDALWTKGRRRQRVRTGVVAAALAVVALLGTTTTPLLVQRAEQVGPAGSDDRMILPDVVRQPGAWEPTFETLPTRLSAVGTGVRDGLWSSRNAWWGVAAATGESRFLDLPGAAVDVGGEPALSADGRRVAYWVTGEVDGVPIVAGQVGEDLEPVVGIAVLDLETGERQVWEVASDHGLSVNGAAWAGDVLWWSAGPVREDEESGAIIGTSELHMWDLSTGDRSEPGGGRPWLGQVGGAPGGFVEQRGDRQVTRVVGLGRPTTLRVTLPEATPEAAAIIEPTMSTDGSRIASLLMPDAGVFDGSPMAVLVGDASARRVEMGAVGDATAQAILGWRSPTDLVVAGLADVEEGRPQQVNRAWTLDVTTGERTPLVDFSGNTPQVAADAWTAEVVPAPGAPFAPDPRLVGLGLLVVALVVWRVLVRVRSRRGHP
nr:hypothetical protein [uncultured Nocardioides sp.]